eukprot:10868568-Karenia_brevis.AAC.1
MRGARTADERVHWAIQCLRAIQDHDDDRFREALLAAPQLLLPGSPSPLLPTTSLHVAHIRSVLQDSLTLSDEQRKAEFDCLKDVPEYMKTSQSNDIQKMYNNHNIKNRTLGINAIIDENDIPQHDPHLASESVVNHWAN